MNTEMLFEAMGNISDEYIVAARERLHKKHHILLPAVALSAAAVLFVSMTLLGEIRLEMILPKNASIGNSSYKEEDIIFYYVDSGRPMFSYPDELVQSMTPEELNEYDKMLEENGFGGGYPLFGNPLQFTGHSNTKNADSVFEKVEHVYLAVYDPLILYSMFTVSEYKNLVKMNYTVENDGKQLKVTYTNIGYPDGLDGDPVEFGHTFIYDIEGASVDHVPTLDEDSIALVNKYYAVLGTTYEEAVEGFKQRFGH